MEFVKLDCSVRGVLPPHTDCDYDFRLDRADVDTLTSDVTKAALAALILATGGAVGIFLSQYVMSKLGEIQANAGPKGAYIKTTIRDGTQLHVWEVYPEG